MNMDIHYYILLNILHFYLIKKYMEFDLYNFHLYLNNLLCYYHLYKIYYYININYLLHLYEFYLDNEKNIEN